jgi:uncharacterized membrane protein YedE/YeeE
MKRHFVAFGSGLLFAIGLSVSGMTRPSKVIGFLDFAGNWDPSLAFVMVGAIAVNVVAVLWARTARSPVFAPSFHVATRRDVDPALVAGAAIFGIGWGLAGYCPGPAVTSLASLAPSTLVFFVSMLAGMRLFALLQKARAASLTSVRAPASSECAPDRVP